MTNDQKLRLECARIGGNEIQARQLYGFITEVPKNKSNVLYASTGKGVNKLSGDKWKKVKPSQPA